MFSMAFDLVTQDMKVTPGYPMGGLIFQSSCLFCEMSKYISFGIKSVVFGSFFTGNLMFTGPLV